MDSYQQKSWIYFIHDKNVFIILLNLSLDTNHKHDKCILYYKNVIIVILKWLQRELKTKTVYRPIAVT